MLRRLKILFARFADRHLALHHRAQTLPDAVGALDRIALCGNRLVVEGWTPADQVVLELGTARAVARPLARPGANPDQPRFHLDVPFGPDPARLTFWTGTTARDLPLPGFPAARIRAARLRLLPGFLWLGLRATPAAIRWFRHRDPAARARVKDLLGLSPQERIHPLLPWRMETAGAPRDEGPIAIVMPVYNAFDLLPEALQRVVDHTDLDWHLILIEDCSTDPKVRPFLRDWAAALGTSRVTLLENAENLGFIGSVNRGFAAALDDDRPVILLNSDAMVPAGWASRLIAPMRADPSVASVTPMSNEAELLSVPVICAPTALRAGEGDAIDAVAKGFGTAQGLVDAPTGVGFCMAINPAYLRRNPTFDPIFGKGYGEEVDWCRKAMAEGGRHLYLPGLFVEHRGGASFGSAEKQRLLQKNGAIVTARYPDFDAQVQRFLADDPLLTPRLILGLAWADARARTTGTAVPIFIGHSLGGGAESYLQRRIATEIEASDGAAVVLRMGGGLRWQIELHSAAGRTIGATQDLAQAIAVLGQISARRVVYSCGVGDPDPTELPGLLCDLAAGPGRALEILIHDYFPLSPSYTLLDADGRYRGLPAPDTRDAAHQLRRPDGGMINLAAWRTLWSPAMAAADEIVVFSAASHALVAAAYPETSERIVVRPHPALHRIPPVTTPVRPRPVIGVLGNIGQQKGAEVLVALSRRLARDPSAELVLIGDLDPAYALARPAVVHGTYRLADLEGLVRRYGLSCWLVPSIWPETFSYVTQEVLATGLPAFGFALGAQGDALVKAAAERGRGGVLPLVDGRADTEALLHLILEDHKKTTPTKGGIQ